MQFSFPKIIPPSELHCRQLLVVTAGPPIAQRGIRGFAALPERFPFGFPLATRAGKGRRAGLPWSKSRDPDGEDEDHLLRMLNIKRQKVPDCSTQNFQLGNLMKPSDMHIGCRTTFTNLQQTSHEADASKELFDI